MLINFCVLKNLPAQTNDIDIFYTNTWRSAWQSTGVPYYGSKNNICFPNDDVILARMEIFNYWFNPHPFNNKFHDVMLEKENKIIDLQFQIKDTKKKNKKLFFWGLGIGSGIVIIPLILVKFFSL